MGQHSTPAASGRSEAIVIEPEEQSGEHQGTRPGESMGEMRDAAGEQAGQMLETVSQRGRQQANQQMDRAAAGLEQLASSVRRLGDQMSEEQPQVAGIANTAAEQAERLSHYLRETDPGQLYQQAESFARRQPALVVGGAFLAGIFAARFLKASGSQGRRGIGEKEYRSQQLTSRSELGPMQGGYRQSPGGAEDGIA